MSLSIRHWLTEHYIELPALASQAQIAGVAFHIVQDMEVKSLTPLDISTLAEILELPLGVVWQELGAIARITGGLLRRLSQKKPIKRNEGTWLAFQIAYLQALQQLLQQEFRLQRPWLDRAILPVKLEVDRIRHGDSERHRGIPLQNVQLQALIKTLRPGRLTDTQAEQALFVVTESFLVQQMNALTTAWFVANGTEELEAKLLIQRLVHGLPGHLIAVITENALALAQLQKFVHLGDLSGDVETQRSTSSRSSAVAHSNTLSIDPHQQRYRAALIQALSEPLFEESFSLKDLYIPLKGVPVTAESHSQVKTPRQDSNKAVDLIQWVTAQLSDTTSITLIEAEPGFGKTSFCQIWAAQVAQELYPSWIPVLIQLRDVTLGKTLEQTLESAFVGLSGASGWLSPPHPPVLFLLDGLDELPRSPQCQSSLAIFLEQVLRFQAQTSSDSGSPQHKIVLTSRPLREWGEKNTPYLSKFQRIAIQPLGQEEFKQWFKQWSQVQTKTIALAYFTFLKQGGLFSRRAEVQELADLTHQPLMLYLLGILHRDGLLEHRILQMTSSVAEFEIYERLNRWLLAPLEQVDTTPVFVQEGLTHIHRTPEAVANLLQGRHPQDLRHQMQVAALRLLQSDRHSSQSADCSSSSTLPAFYFRRRDQWAVVRSNEQRAIKIEFSHAKLGEYLCAEEIAAQLKFLTQRALDCYGETVVDSPEGVAQHLYNLLGYGILAPEIEQLVIERLRREQTRQAETFSFQFLFERLQPFYHAYCRGRWLDAGMAHAARSRFQELQNPINALQVDAAVGLNVFLLLCACNREAEVSFWPCGNPAISAEFNPEALLALIGRTAVLSPLAFAARMRSPALTALNLAGVCLNQATLVEANLWRTDLSTAELIGTNLAGANLKEANLTGANLSGANLSGANLSGTNLEGANLTGANLQNTNLSHANLTKTCLFQAQLGEAEKNTAIANGALFSLEEFQAYQQKKGDRFDSSDLEETVHFSIESAEGIPASTGTPNSTDDGGNEETAYLERPAHGYQAD